MFAIIIWIILFMTLVLIHEFGHFIAAKKSWVQVKEFGIWIPPKLFTLYTDKDWTEYTVNLLPLWWFVRLKWEDLNNEADLKSKDSFLAKNIWKKMLILFGWVSMNLIFAYLLFVITLTIWIKPINIMPANIFGIEIKSESYLMPDLEFARKNNFIIWWEDSIKTLALYVLTWSSAEKMWMKDNDKILAINWNEFNWFEFWPTYLKDNQLCGKDINIDIMRWEEKINLQWNIDLEWCKLWIYPAPDLDKDDINIVKMPFLKALWAGIHEIKAQTNLTFTILWSLGKNLLSFNKEKIKDSVNKMSGPVWAVKVWEIILNEYWIWQYLAFGGMISLALALFNILPLPALDWGRALSILIQNTLRLKPQKYFVVENYINMTFFFLLLGLGVYIILLDLTRFWGLNIPGIN